MLFHQDCQGNLLILSGGTQLSKLEPNIIISCFVEVNSTYVSVVIFVRNTDF